MTKETKKRIRMVLMCIFILPFVFFFFYSVLVMPVIKETVEDPISCGILLLIVGSILLVIIEARMLLNQYKYHDTILKKK